MTEPHTPTASRSKRTIGAIYSKMAKSLYEPLVVHGSFKLFAPGMNDVILEHGRAAAAHARRRPILDMPVGTGYFTVETAAAHDGILVACDIAEGMVRRARTAAANKGLSNLVVLQADAHHLPFADGSFPAVTSSNGLQVIPGTERALAELVRVLAPGGKLFIAALSMPVGRGSRDGTVSPGLLVRGRVVAGLLQREGLKIFSTRQRGLAYLIEATKP
ncbi:MAG TPA: methyltransferase domain-containing protein [Actinomycetota bacterium]|nr:methyltransferase domain-containing protein [Actinomycetota bacterium]